MAKIGTAHVEIKPVLNQEALDAICKRIADAVAEAVQEGLESTPGPDDLAARVHSLIVHREGCTICGAVPVHDAKAHADHGGEPIAPTYTVPPTYTGTYAATQLAPRRTP